ncbi:hypothetical protein L7F22_012674 [Adiantum nelumboides]|nr:hypothetical protein [Adiantum nelumboides]
MRWCLVGGQEEADTSDKVVEVVRGKVLRVRGDQGLRGGSKFVGINYGHVDSTLMSATKAVALIKSLGVGLVRLPDANAQVLAALANSGLDVVISVRDEDIPSLAAHESRAMYWIQKNVIAFFPDTNITIIDVGDNIMGSQHPRALMAQLLPAMANLYNALLQHDLTNLIKVTTSFSMNVFATTFPPSLGTFRADIAQPFIVPILDFLTQTQTPLLLNVYPYLAWQNDPNHIPLSFALFDAPSVPIWLDKKLSYYNLLDVQLDAVAYAMENLGYPNLDIVISKTGWPTAGGANATMTYAFKYNQGLVNKVIESPGTPHRPKREVPAFIYSLVDEGSTRLKWGVFKADGSMVYPLKVGQPEAGTSAQSPVMGPGTGPASARDEDSVQAPAAVSGAEDKANAATASASALAIHGVPVPYNDNSAPDPVRDDSDSSSAPPPVSGFG